MLSFDQRNYYKTRRIIFVIFSVNFDNIIEVNFDNIIELFEEIGHYPFLDLHAA